MSDTTTPNYSFTLPAIGASQDTWGNKLNANWVLADSTIHGITSGYLPLAGGGTISGSLVLSPPSGYAILTLNKPAGANSSQLEGARVGIPRWEVLLGDATLETGGSAGSNFSVNRYDDVGTYLGSPLSINRASGNVTVQQAMSIGASLAVGTALSIAAGDFVLYRSAPSRILQWQSGWSIAFSESNGSTGWNSPSGQLMGLDGSGNLAVSQGFSCQSTGVRYNNIGPNGFNFRWNSTNLYARVDNAIEFALQAQSDERLKGDIAPSTFDCLAAVMATPLFEFRWKSLGQTPDLETATVAHDAPLVPVGFVAQRQHEVFPASVMPGSETSSGHARATTMWQMDHNTLCAALCGAIQQLTERVAALELQLG